MINVAQIVSQLFDPRVTVYMEDSKNPAFTVDHEVCVTPT